MDNLSIVGKPENYVIERCMPETFHSGSVTASNVIDVNPASTSLINILETEVLDIEKDNCGDAFQHQPTKFPSMRKVGRSISL